MGMTIIDAKTLKKAFLAGAQNLEAKKEWINIRHKEVYKYYEKIRIWIYETSTYRFSG